MDDLNLILAQYRQALIYPVFPKPDAAWKAQENDKKLDYATERAIQALKLRDEKKERDFIDRLEVALKNSHLSLSEGKWAQLIISLKEASGIYETAPTN